MTSLSIRQQLHEYIDTTDDDKIEALYSMFQNEINRQYSIPQEELNMLHERAEKYLNGETKTYTVGESHDMIRKQRKK